MSKPYMPSNGTEGEFFIEGNCCLCVHEEDCKILMDSFAGIQSEFWITDENGPRCTKLATEEEKPVADENQISLF